jgi:hypothetical protein
MKLQPLGIGIVKVPFETVLLLPAYLSIAATKFGTAIVLDPTRSLILGNTHPAPVTLWYSIVPV